MPWVSAVSQHVEPGWPKPGDSLRDRPARRRHGIVFIAVLILGAILVIFAFAYHTAMRRGRLLTHRSLYGQYASVLARSGLEMARALVLQEIRNPDSSLYRGLSRPLEDLIASGPGPVVLDTVDMVSRFPVLVDSLSEEFPGGSSCIESFEARYIIEPAELSPLPDLPIGDRVVKRSHREKSGRLHVELVARLSFAPIDAGIERRVRSYTEFRVTHPPIPMLSEFSLLVAAPPPSMAGDGRGTLNALSASHQGYRSPTDAAPLILDNGTTHLQRMVSQELNLDLLKKQGWVYLGGDPVILNLSYSQEESSSPDQVGEDFHFFQQNPTNLAAGRAVSDPVASDEANKHLGTDFWDVRNWDMGVHSLTSEPLASEYGRVFAETPEGKRRGSLIKLFGVSPDRVSPTFVLGNVLAGFFRITATAPKNSGNNAFDAFYTILMDHRESSGFLNSLYDSLVPFLGKLLYLFDPFYSGKFVFYDPNVLGGLLGPGQSVTEDTYRKICSGHFTRNYNQALLHLKKRNESPNATSAIVSLGLPESCFGSDSSLDERSSIPGPLLPDPWVADLAGLNLSNTDLAALGPALVGAASWQEAVATDGADVLKSRGLLKGSILDLGTTMSLEGKLTLPPLTTVRRGGVLLAESITITGPIPASDGGGPLVLIATEGGIQIPAATPIHASLICLKGKVRIPRDMDLTGNLVTQEIDLDDLMPTGPAGGPAHLKFDDSKLKTHSFEPNAPFVIDVSRRFVRVD